MKCQACEEPGVAQIIYGSYQAIEKGWNNSFHTVFLCLIHGKELWSRCANAVNSNLMFWNNYQIKGEENVS